MPRASARQAAASPLAHFPHNPTRLRSRQIYPIACPAQPTHKSNPFWQDVVFIDEHQRHHCQYHTTAAALASSTSVRSVCFPSRAPALSPPWRRGRHCGSQPVNRYSFDADRGCKTTRRDQVRGASLICPHWVRDQAEWPSSIAGHAAPTVEGSLGQDSTSLKPPASSRREPVGGPPRRK